MGNGARLVPAPGAGQGPCAGAARPPLLLVVGRWEPGAPPGETSWRAFQAARAGGGGGGREDGKEPGSPSSHPPTPAHP